MIIGLSGKMQSGKDTVARMLQYLTDKDKNGYTYPISVNDFESYLANKHDKHSFWERKAFAYAVKQVCSILTGIPVEDFEKQEVKDRILGEEWIRYGYADGFMRKMDGTPIMNNKQCSKEKYEQELRTNWQTAYKHEYTVRELLQLVGTNAIRNVIHEDAWVNALMSEYTPKICSGVVHCALAGKYNISCWKCPEYPNWIITDVRFPNEVKAIKDRGGIIIRVNRINSTPQDGYAFVDKQTKTHPSEIALDDYHFDYTIDNNSTVEDLLVNVETLYCVNLKQIIYFNNK